MKTKSILAFLYVPLILFHLACQSESKSATPPQPTIKASETLTATSANTPTSTTKPSPTQTPTVTSTPSPTLVPEEDFIKGISIPAYMPEIYSQPYTPWTLENIVRPLGANWINIHFMCYQENHQSTEIYCKDNRTPTNEELEQIVEYAHRVGLRVLLEIGIMYESDPNHGNKHLGQYFNDQQWQTWFTNYADFITGYAILADELEIDMFSIGSELPGTIHRSENWRAVANKVEEKYQGQITYSSVDERYWTQISWWDAVDMIGIHPYDLEYSRKNDPSVAEMKANILPVVDQLEQIANKFDRPVIITELYIQGLDEINKGRQAVFDDPEFELDLQEQAQIFQALIAALRGRQWWRGAFFSNLPLENIYGDPQNFHTDLSGKPAENVLRSFYGQKILPTPTPFAEPELMDTSDEPIYVDSLNSAWYHYPPNPNYVDFQYKEISFQGNSIKADLYPWHGLVFGKTDSSAINLEAYEWLEFYIYLPKTVVASQSWHNYDPVSIKVAFKNKAFRNATPYVIDLAYSSYVEGGQLQPNRWQRVLIPLSSFGPELTPAREIVISNNTWQSSVQIYIDTLRLINSN